MSLFQFQLPDIGEGVTEGEVVNWLVKVGAQVVEDEPMVEVMTDKATVVIGAPKAGKIAELKATVGERVKVGDVLVVIETGNGARVPASGRSSQMPAQVVEVASDTAVSASGAVAAGASFMSGPSYAVGATGMAAQEEQLADRPLATPAVRKLARELGVDLRKLKPSGPGARLTKEEVLAYANRPKEVPVGPGSAPPQPAQNANEKRIPFVGLRRRIAERMEAARDTAVHYTFVEECEVDRLMAVREKLKPEAQARGVDLSYLPFIVQATVAALKKFPMLNATLDTTTNELVMRDYYNIGIATATEQGLIVPVIHHAQNLDLFQIAEAIQRLSQAALKNRLTVADLNGSTFTVTSLGRQGGLLATPVINLPNVGILGVHRIKQRPIVRDGQIVIGNIMLLSLSLDHRIVDGQVGALFAYDIIGYLENPSRLFG
jgi:pyruvate dehydrogenase E2 component (dihydrolipoamide acetyltransferase)